MRSWQALIPVLGGLVLAGTAVAAPTPVAGVYQATIKGKASLLNGTWLISFAPSGAYTVAKEPATRLPLIGGVSKVSHQSLSFDDKTGPLACTGAQAKAVYSWSRSGSKLILKPVHETCAGREAILASGPLTKVG